MKYFQKIGQCNVQPLIAALARQPELWDQNPIRTTHQGTVHADASDILLRYNDPNSEVATIDNIDNVDFPAFALLPQARALVFDLMRLVEGNRLGRVFITKLPSTGRILPHKDEGKSPEYYDRYHIILQNYLGSEFRTGDETVCMNGGDVYWFNNKIEHEVFNDSIDDRISLIVDIRSK
jgi:hypothetical protein